MDGTEHEQQRRSTGGPTNDSLGRHVADFSQLPPGELPTWLTRLRLPAGWRTGRLEGSGHQPWRIAVYGERTGGGWDGCETIGVFGFTGFPPLDLIRRNSEWTLRNLQAETVESISLAAPSVEGVYAIRSNGHCNTAGLEVWAQYSFYVAGSDTPGAGRMIQHCLFAESTRQAALKDDIARLTDAIHNGFITAVNAGHL